MHTEESVGNDLPLTHIGAFLQMKDSKSLPPLFFQVPYLHQQVSAVSINLLENFSGTKWHISPDTYPKASTPTLQFTGIVILFFFQAYYHDIIWGNQCWKRPSVRLFCEKWDRDVTHQINFVITLLASIPAKTWYICRYHVWKDLICSVFFGKLASP